MTGPMHGGGQRRDVGAPDGRPHSLLIVPDASNSPSSSGSGAAGAATYYVLRRQPVVVAHTPQSPVFSLTMLLSRPVTAADEHLAPLVDRGALAMDLTLRAGEQQLRELAKDGGDYRPLFLSEVDCKLEDEQGAMLASGRGSSWQVTIDGMLAPGPTLAVLDALGGIRRGLQVRTSVSFKTAAAPKSVLLRGSWREIHQRLQLVADAGGVVTLAILREAFQTLLAGDTPILSVQTGDGTAPTFDSMELFEHFLSLSSVVLQRLTPYLQRMDPDNRYRLRTEPHPMFRLEYRVTVRTTGKETLHFTHPLEEILGGLLHGLDRDRFLRIVAPQTGGGTVAPAPRKVRSERTMSRASEDQPMRLAATSRGVGSMAVASGAMQAKPAAMLLQSDVLTAAAPAGAVKQWWVDDVRIPYRPVATPMPVVADPAAAVWVDRVNAANLWYAPEFQLITPEPNGNPATSAFFFQYRQSGVTPSGQPALEATVRFRFRAVASTATQSELARRGNPAARPVPLQGVSCGLLIPYVDERDNSPRSTLLQAAVEKTGEEYTATVRIMNEWVRVAYTVLSRTDVQGGPAKLVASYSYQAAVPIRDEAVSLNFVNKTALLPVKYGRKDRWQDEEEPYFDAVEGVYHHSGGEVLLRGEEPSRLPPPPPIDFSRGVATAAALAVAPVIRATMLQKAKPVSIAIARPELKPAVVLPEIVREVKYATQTLLREQRIPAVYPCASLGAFYVEESLNGAIAIGCRDALQLGRTSLRLYEEVGALARPGYRVYRSLQQPGRFLVMPAAYRIGRFDANEGERAYGAMIFIYQSLDAAQPGNNRIAFEAVLQPDLSVLARRRLAEDLARLARDPVVEYPHEVAADVGCDFAIPANLGAEARNLRTPSGFQVSIGTDVAGSLLLQSMLANSGVSGIARLSFADQSELNCPLLLDLRHIAGPWSSGPLDVQLSGGAATVVNRIERPVEVRQLVSYNGSGVSQNVAVARLLAAGEACSVPAGQAVEALPDYQIPPADPETIRAVRVFMEDVRWNVVFRSQVNFENHDLTQLAVHVKLPGQTVPTPVPLTGTTNPSGSIEIVSPLLEYLNEPVLEFRVTKTFRSGAVADTPWIGWDLRNGVVIAIQWEMIQ